MRKTLLIAAILPVLAGCVSDGAAVHIDGKEHSLSIVREQKWAWDDKLDIYLVATRMPECQRRHKLKPAPVRASGVDVFMVDLNTYHLRQGSRWYRIETKTCEGFESLKGEPDKDVGDHVGTFKMSEGSYRFVEKPAKKDDKETAKGS